MGPPHAVAILEELPTGHTGDGGHCSKDPGPQPGVSRLLKPVKKALLEWANMPLQGVSRGEFFSHLQRMADTDRDLRQAEQRRQQAFDDFMQLVDKNEGRIVANYLDDLVVGYYDVSADQHDIADDDYESVDPYHMADDPMHHM